jgi:cysteinyl-tRNA synthetase
MVRVRNRLTGEKEDFEPLEEGKVRLYVCGLTPYTDIHAGHARTYVAFDIVRRWLEHRGYDVVHVQNITDVEDKIIDHANETGGDPLRVAKREHAKAEAIFDELRLERADHWPKVSDHVQHIIETNQAILDNGHAYVAEGNVYFDVDSFEDYGKLSNQDPDELIEEHRDVEGEGKEDPRDFALWKKAKPGEPSWDSPWGEGRPGWHIECSVMATTILGPRIDIHGGGKDLTFPHHENEIAQSEAATGEEPFTRYWMHTGFVTVGDEKMSKSLGNFVTAREVLDEHRPEAIRLLVAQTHYRSPIDFSWEALEEAETTLDRLLAPLRRVRDAEPRTDGARSADRDLVDALQAAEAEFGEAMDDDFDTPGAVAALQGAATRVNQYLDEHDTPHEDAVAAVESLYGFVDDVLAIVPPEDDLAGLETELVDLLLEVRQQARDEKAFEIADAVRDGLGDLGIEVEDTEEGPRWHAA